MDSTNLFEFVNDRFKSIINFQFIETNLTKISAEKFSVELVYQLKNDSPKTEYDIALIKQDIIKAIAKVLSKEYHIGYFDVIFLLDNIVINNSNIHIKINTYLKEGSLYLDLIPNELIVEMMLYMDIKSLKNFITIKEYDFYKGEEIYLKLISKMDPHLHKSIINIETVDNKKHIKDYKYEYFYLHTGSVNHTILGKLIIMYQYFKVLYPKIHNTVPDEIIKLLYPEVRDEMHVFDLSTIYGKYNLTGEISDTSAANIIYTDLHTFKHSTGILYRLTINVWLLLNEDKIVPKNTHQLITIISFLIRTYRATLIKHYFKLHPELLAILPPKDQVININVGGKEINVVKYMYENI